MVRFTRIEDLQKSSELDIACEQLRQAIVKASLCGYVRTVKEEHELKVREGWRALSRGIHKR